METNELQAIRDRAALELLRMKAARKMCEGKTTCLLDENDIQDVLFVAGMEFKDKVQFEIKLDII